MKEINLQVNSEIGRLRSILLHRPRFELNNLVPDNMKRLLFDDLPDAEMASEEYDVYVKVLQDAGVEIHYIEDLVAETLDANGIKEEFLRNFLSDHNFDDPEQIDVLMQYFMDINNNQELVQKLICGIRKEEASPEHEQLFRHRNGENDFFIMDPLPNLYFTRDPFTVIGDTVSINTMYAQARHPETRFAQVVFAHHPQLKKYHVHNEELVCSKDRTDHIEGGDILLLNEETVAIGISERTNAQGIRKLAQSMFEHGGTKNLKVVLAFEIPSKRAYMHLDTVFTQLSEDCYVVHPLIEGELVVHEITKDSFVNGSYKTKEVHGKLDEILSEYTGVDNVRLIKCGGGSPVDAEREQWNDGANTLAIAPGEVIVYGRNRVTNQLFEEAGIKIHKLPVSELVLGRGGPHCMSMPLNRDLL